ncbi:MAG: 30S ribosomal protein S20 [Spirochaetaceae bacterium]|nr:30S ribosomal protein S20 [Spirochaetaceae bacterium]
MALKGDSAAKKHRQSEVRRLRNKTVKSSLRTSVRKFTELVSQKKTGDAEAALNETLKKLDSAAGKGVIKKNAASRKKSRMQKRFNSLKSAAS